MKIHFYRIMCLSACLVLVVGRVSAQSTVSGEVASSEDGTALPGVNVLVKGTSLGTVTDIDGKYRISVPPDGSILTFSFIGFQSQDVEIGN